MNKNFEMTLTSGDHATEVQRGTAHSDRRVNYAPAHWDVQPVLATMKVELKVFQENGHVSEFELSGDAWREVESEGLEDVFVTLCCFDQGKAKTFIDAAENYEESEKSSGLWSRIVTADTTKSAVVLGVDDADILSNAKGETVEWNEDESSVYPYLGDEHVDARDFIKLPDVAEGLIEQYVYQQASFAREAAKANLQVELKALLSSLESLSFGQDGDISGAETVDAINQHYDALVTLLADSEPKQEDVAFLGDAPSL